MNSPINSNNLKTVIALGALAFTCSAAQAQQLGSTPRLALVSTLLSNVGQPLNLGAATSNVGLLGAGALSSNLNGLLSGGNRGANTSTTTLPALSININVLNGNTGLLRSVNAAGTP